MRLAPHLQRVEDLSSEVAAENSPSQVVEGQADIFAYGHGLKVISENSTLSDQGLVGKGVGGDEYDRVRAEVESEDLDVLGVQVTENWFELQ